MKRAWIVYTVVGVILYLFFLLATAPAAFVAMALQRATGGSALLQGVSGSVWSGRGELVLRRPYGNSYSFGNGQWRINPLWIVTGRIGLHLRFAGDGQISGDLRASPGAVTVVQLNAHAAAPLIQILYAPAALIDPHGALTLAAHDLQISSNKVSGNAEVKWSDAQSSLANVNPLGDYRLQLNGKGDALDVKLDTLKGALNLAGTGQWRVRDRHLDFHGEARPIEHAAELEPMLKLFGRDLGGGRRELIVNLRIP